jgi:hypothetical protein
MTVHPGLICKIAALGHDWRDNANLPYTVDANKKAWCADVPLHILADGGDEVIRKCVELAYHWRYSRRLPMTPATE